MDDLITRYEPGCAAAIGKWRNLPPGAAIRGEEAAEVAVHLGIRVANIRESFASAMSEIVSGLGKQLLRPRRLSERLGLHEDPPGRPVQELLDEIWNERRPELQERGIDRERLQRALLQLLRTHGDELLSSALPRMAEVLRQLEERANHMAAEAHRLTLRKTLAPEPRVETLAPFSWSVQEGPPHGCMLPDCVAVATLTGGLDLPLAFSGSDEIERITMPISATAVLVGCRGGTPAQPASQSGQASACWDYFVTRSAAPEFQEAAGHIGRAIRPFLKSAVSESLAGIG